jgi:hypothetical protein
MNELYPSGYISDRIGNKFWFAYGYRHRENGPAVELVNGYKEWWYHGENIEEKLGIKIESVEQYQELINILVFS